MSRASRVLAVTRRDLQSLSREKTIVLALLIQLFVAAFSSFLVVGLTSLYNPSAVEGGGIDLGVAGNASDDLLAAAREQEGLDTTVYPDERAAKRAFQQGEVEAVVVATHEQRRIAVDVTAPKNSLRKTLVVTQVREVLERLERMERRQRAEHLDHRLAPLPPEIEASPYFGFSYTVLIPLLVFLPVFISGSVAVDSVTEEIERGTLELLRVAPISLPDVVAGKALGMTALAPAQAGLWLALLSLNGIQIAHVAPLLVLVTALAVGFVSFGVGLSLTVPNRQRAQLLYSLSALLFFTAAALLPEHPATTVALLAVDSPTATTYGLVAAYTVLGVAVAGGVSWLVTRVDPERL